jgi:hypothetical protein
LREVSPEQEAVCRRYGVEPAPTAAHLKVGIAPNVKQGVRPIKAIRHLIVGDTTGSYIWGGDVEAADQSDGFFEPLHVAHLSEWCPEIEPYLALPPGWAVIVASGYEDVWFDPSYLVE